jgi:hypothetical protein
VKKQEVLALLEDLPDEFDAGRLLCVLAIKDAIERAEAECAASAQASRAGSGRDHREGRAARRYVAFSRLYDNKDLMARLQDACKTEQRRDHWIPFRQVQDQARRRGDER